MYKTMANNNIRKKKTKNLKRETVRYQSFFLVEIIKNITGRVFRFDPFIGLEFRHFDNTL